MALKMLLKMSKMIFGVRPALRPWLFLMLIYYVPAIIFNIIKYLFYSKYSNLVSNSKGLIIQQWCLLGMVIFDYATAIVAIILLLFKRSLNSESLAKRIPKQYYLGALIPIVFPLFEHVLPAIVGPKNSNFKTIMSLSSDKYLIMIYLLWIINIAIIGPIQEEIIFRGIIQGYFKELYGGTRAIFLSTFAFSAVHIANVIFLNISVLYLGFIMFMSLLLCAVREKTNNLSFCFAFHISNNFLWCIFATVFASHKLPMELIN